MASGKALYPPTIGARESLAAVCATSYMAAGCSPSKGTLVGQHGRAQEEEKEKGSMRCGRAGGCSRAEESIVVVVVIGRRRGFRLQREIFMTIMLVRLYTCTVQDHLNFFFTSLTRKVTSDIRVGLRPACLIKR